MCRVGTWVLVDGCIAISGGGVVGGGGRGRRRRFPPLAACGSLERDGEPRRQPGDAQLVVRERGNLLQRLLSHGARRHEGDRDEGVGCPEPECGLGTHQWHAVLFRRDGGQLRRRERRVGRTVRDSHLDPSPPPPPPPPPPAPTGVRATAGDNTVTVSWDAAAGATSYNIYYRTAAGVTKTNGTPITGATSPRVVTGLT